METGNRMDGLSSELGRALLKLIGMLFEGKVRTVYTLQIRSFILDVLEKVKFFNYVYTRHPEIMNKYEELFDALMGDCAHAKMCDNPSVKGVINEINEMRSLYKWKGMLMDSCGRFPLFDESDDSFILKESLKDCIGVILVPDGFRSKWIWKGEDEINSLPKILKEMDYKKIKCVIRFELIKENLVITFLNINNTD